MRLSIVEAVRTFLAILILSWLALSHLQAQGKGNANPAANRHLTFSPDGRLLAASYGEIEQPGILRIWDWQSGQTVLERREPVGVCSASFSPDGKSIAVGTFDKVGRVLDVATGKIRTEFRGHDSYVRTVAYINANLIASGSYDKTIRLWNANTGLQVRELGKHTDQLRTVAVSADGRFLISGSISPDCRLWDLVNMQEIALFDSPGFICPNVCFSRDGEFVLTARWDNTVRIRDTVSRRILAAVKVGAKRTIDLSPDNSLLLACDDKLILHAVDLRLAGATAEETTQVMEHVKLWNSDDYQVREKASRDILEMGAVVIPLLDRIKGFTTPEIRIRARTIQETLEESSSRDVDVGHEFNVGAVCFSPDNIHVASGDVGGVVKVWRFRDETVVQTFEPSTAPGDKETSLP